MQIMYQANDGKLFTTKEDCLVYENEVEVMLKVAEKISHLCQEMSECERCPFYKDVCQFNGTPCEWDFYDEDEDDF